MISKYYDFTRAKFCLLETIRASSHGKNQRLKPLIKNTNNFNSLVSNALSLPNVTVQETNHRFKELKRNRCLFSCY